MKRTLWLVVLLSCPVWAWEAVPEGESAPLPFYEYDPPSTLVVPSTFTTRARFPLVDAHAHLFDMADQDLAPLVAEMDRLNMAVLVNLSGRGFRQIQDAEGNTRYAIRDGDYLKRSVENAQRSAPGRFVVFTNLDLEGFGEAGWGVEALRQLEEDVTNGARGLKIYKSLGLEAKDSDGRRIRVDDPRLDPLWAKCAELHIPVLIHTGEPAAFWLPKNGDNERWFELIQKPQRYRAPDLFPTWEEVMGEQHNVFRMHPETTFINAHLGWMGNDLARLGRLLEEFPNVYTEIGAVLAELGRQPRFARQWFLRYQDRVMFGKDAWAPEEYQVYFRALETADEYFPYYRRRHAFWRIYGLELPDEVLRKLYYGNALKVIPGIDPALFEE